MKRSSSSTPSTPSATLERNALRKRIRQFYSRFNVGDWAACYSLIDPKLVAEKRVKLNVYADLMHKFKEAYGGVNPWHLRLSLHLDPSLAQRDKRPFAFVYLVWQDATHGFHMFRERWVKVDDRRYTRVVGLVPNANTQLGE